MKNINTILIVLIVLSGLGFSLAFFVIKKKKEEENSDTTKETNQPTESNPLDENSEVDSSIPSDISILHLDTLNRRFEFSMSYSGIQHKGEFIEGATNLPFVRKSFGIFRIAQRSPVMKTIRVPKDGNVSGERTKGSAAVGLTGGTATEIIEVEIPTPSDWVVEKAQV